ncbi:replication factor C subunit 5 [Brachionus plicatilis]|uniref:Activator 1 subunit 5 n=1 Tax=Brachionus plicatilis TaxID=10195 RepID=A0A3M7S4F2_BRAPC|nr:replication factor C subunit 5 [Brachionus plicatilis]
MALPWIEKYRPKNLGELISQDSIVETIQKFIKNDQMPHLLFYGPPGTGKTSTILACAKQLYSPSEFNAMVLELNASDDRGIGIVRDQIMSFASTKTIFKKGFKLIILDEADAMTNDAQNALRRILEKFTDNTRFCIICNYLSKIIPAIQSRCTRFRFGPLTEDKMKLRLDHIIQIENVDITEDGMKAVVHLASGDMRKALNIMQSTHLAFNKVNEENVYNCVGHPSKNDMLRVINSLLNDDFTTIYNKLIHLKTLKGYALQDILTEVSRFVQMIELPTKALIHVLEKLSDIEYRLSNGTNEKLQMSSLISTFITVRSMCDSKPSIPV